MLSSSKIKFINSLKLKKYRTESGLFIAEGSKVVNDLRTHNYDIMALYATPEYIESLSAVSDNSNTEVVAVSEKELGRISGLTTPNQVLAVCKMKKYPLDMNDILSGWSLVLDGVNDPGNLGTIIRIAHWFNIKNIICAENTVDVYNAKTV